MSHDPYQEFLQGKVIRVEPTGFDIDEGEINRILFGWQRAVVKQALKNGKYALFEECGLGKTFQQLEWAKHVQIHTGGKVLVCAPLAVAHQTIEQGRKLGIGVTYIRDSEEAKAPGIYITNYDMLKKLVGVRWDGVVLDESSILKNYTGSMKKLILRMFQNTTYKLACTATPAPNDHLELGNHAEFLGVMRSTDMLERWFINDTMQAGNYRLRHHAEKDYWEWVTSWAVCISKPSDIGYPDFCDEYSFQMPQLIINNETVGVDHSRAWDSGQMFVDGTLSATQMWREKKFTVKQRCEKTREIIGESTAPWIIWCETNQEADLLKKLFPHAVEVRGSDKFADKERKLDMFTNGEVQIIITKADIAGFGLNWQHCNDMIFVGLSYSFEKVYQALRRAWRFGQKLDVRAWFISAESEGNIVKTIQIKQRLHQEMQRAMCEAMQVNGLVKSDIRTKKMTVDERESNGVNWRLLLGDCVTRSRELADNSIHFSIYSPPFKGLYIYSDNIADMGNCATDAEFFEHYRYLIRELYRATMPGRLTAVHCKDLPMYHNRDGAAGLNDFPGEIVRAHCQDEKLTSLNIARMTMLNLGLDVTEIDKAIALRLQETGPSWIFHSRVTIWKDPVIEMQRTKNHGLLHKNFTARAEVVRQGMADYLLVFRKWDGVVGTESTEPVKQNRVPGDYIGTNPPADSDDRYSIAVWQRYASPVWFDINQTNVLNKNQAREAEDEKHICPLQLDVCERSIDLWSNLGDLVCDPFTGIGSTGVSALKLKRRFVGMELKDTYFDVSTRNLTAAEAKYNMPDLFSMHGITV
jgi:hypothetical protein